MYRFRYVTGPKAITLAPNAIYVFRHVLGEQLEAMCVETVVDAESMSVAEANRGFRSWWSETDGNGNITTL